MAVVKITDNNFETEVLAAKEMVVLDFWGEGCAPCRMQSPIIDALADELDGKVKFGKVNVNEEAALSLKYSIMNIPTIIVMNQGVFKEKVIGLQDKAALMALIERCGKAE